MSALYVSDAIYQVVADASASVGSFGHGYTYSGHPLACAVALETLRIYESDDIVGHVQRVAPRFKQGLQRFAGHEIVGHVRALGLIGAIELAEDPKQRKPFDPAARRRCLFRQACAGARADHALARRRHHCVLAAADHQRGRDRRHASSAPNARSPTRSSG